MLSEQLFLSTFCRIQIKNSKLDMDSTLHKETRTQILSSRTKINPDPPLRKKIPDPNPTFQQSLSSMNIDFESAYSDRIRIQTFIQI